MKKVQFLLLLTLFVLCGCAEQGGISQVSNNNISGETTEFEEVIGVEVTGECYRLTVPEDWEVEKQAGNSLHFVRNGETVGGVLVLSCAWDDQSVFVEESDFANEVFTDIVEQLLDEEEAIKGYIFSDSLYGQFELSIATDLRAEIHYFFLHDSWMYDLWFEESALTWDQQEMAISSFEVVK